MTVVVNNASNSLVRALKEMVKLDGAFIAVENDDEYPKDFVTSLLKEDKEISRKRKNGTLKVFDSVDEMFAEL